VKAQRPALQHAADVPAAADPVPGRTRAVLDSSPNPIVAIDQSARISYLNARAEVAFGYSRDELLGQPLEILLPPGAAGRHVALRNDFLAHPIVRPMGIGMDLAGRRKDGSEFPVDISLFPMETADGPRVFATIFDLTARKATENQLLQAQKLEAIGRLAGGIAHDFNNVLFAIKGYAELLSEDLAPDRRAHLDLDEALRSVEAISAAATRAASLTAQLLAFSRQQVVGTEVLELNAAIKTAEPILRRLIGEGHRLVVRPGPDAGRLRLGRGQLHQILVNLVINARDAMPDGGTITIESGNVELGDAYVAQHPEAVRGPHVYVSVSDTGAGMDADTRAHAFEPFFTTKAEGKGTGLGLPSIFNIVQQAGGHIWLSSEPGSGLAFRIYFHRTDELALSPPAAQPARGSVGTGVVMVVEDESSVREMTSKLLRRAGYEVRIVANGLDALEQLAAPAPPIDVLVTDVVMPGMSGIVLAERVLDQLPRAGVVLLSGYTAETLDLERILRRGGLFLSKPVATDELLAAVARAAEHRSAPTHDRR
jgi:PAS domain S-box-containing protein